MEDRTLGPDPHAEAIAAGPDALRKYAIRVAAMRMAERMATGEATEIDLQVCEASVRATIEGERRHPTDRSEGMIANCRLQLEVIRMARIMTPFVELDARGAVLD